LIEYKNHMIRKFLFAVAMFAMASGFACAQVEVNKADQAALDGVRGIGPKLSRTILEARKQGGDFKDWDDFANRVNGVGAKSTDKLSRAGLLINGQSKPGAPPAPAKLVAPVAAVPDR
jgi:competence protein ComEA